MQACCIERVPLKAAVSAQTNWELAFAPKSAASGTDYQMLSSKTGNFTQATTQASFLLPFQ